MCLVKLLKWVTIWHASCSQSGYSIVRNLLSKSHFAPLINMKEITGKTLYTLLMATEMTGCSRLPVKGLFLVIKPHRSF